MGLSFPFSMSQGGWVQKRVNRFFLDNKQASCFLFSTSFLLLIVLVAGFYAYQIKQSYNENLQLRYSELLSLQKMYETEKSETQRIERQLQELGLEIAAKEGELEKIKTQSRAQLESAFDLSAQRRKLSA